MKLSFLLASLACALAGNVKADNPQIVIHSTHAEEDARAYAAAATNELQTYGSLYHRIAMTKPAVSWVEREYKKWLDEQNVKPQPIKLLEGDQLPQISQVYDDEATIKIYLRDSGYTDLSNAKIQQVSAYMRAHGIKHISELADLQQAFLVVSK